MLETLAAPLKVAGSVIAFITRKTMSIRSKGVQFHPTVSANSDGSYSVEAWLKPGDDEVCFQTFCAPGCDIARGFKHKVEGAYFKDRIPIYIVTPSSHDDRNERSVNFIIRPRRPVESIVFTIKGGWLTQLSARRYLRHS